MAATRITIKMFIVTDSTGTRTLGYIIHNEISGNDRPGGTVRAHSKSKIRWTSDDGDFSIDFTDPSPLDPPELHLDGKEGTPTPFKTLKTLPLSGGTNPVFKYTADVGGVTDDPEIIIDDSGGGPKTKKTTAKSKPKASKQKK